MLILSELVPLSTGSHQAGNWKNEHSVAGAASDIIRKLFAMSMDGKDKEACRTAADTFVQKIVSTLLSALSCWLGKLVACASLANPAEQDVAAWTATCDWW